MAKKLKDIVVKTGSYTDGTGQTKNRYKTVGSLIEGEYGPFIMLDRTFNPAGLASGEGKDRVILNLFAPRDQQETAPQQPAPQQPTPQQPAPQAGTFDDDDVPF